MGSPYFGGKTAALVAQEKLTTPDVRADPHAHHLPGFVAKGSKAKSKATTKRVSKTTYPATSGMGALAAATGGSYAFDKPATLRPEDIKTLHHAVEHNAGVRTLAEIAGDPTGLISAGKAVAALAKHPNVSTGIGAGIGAAGLLPFGRLGKLKAAAEAAKEAEAAAHTTEEAAKVRGALQGMKVARTKTATARSAELKARVQKADVHLGNKSLSADERVGLALGEHKGALPKVNHSGLTDLNPAELERVKTSVLDHPNLLHFQKIRLARAIDKAHAGEPLQKNEIDLMEHVFGKQYSPNGGLKNTKFNTALSALNIPRSIMASFDLSAPFRQGLVVATRHPAIFAKNFVPMVKAFGSEKVYNAVHDEIQSRATYPMMLEAKLAITKLGHAVGEREEQFGSDLAEKIPVAGRGVRSSGRAYTAFLDKTRADVFDHLIKVAQSQGANVQDEKFLKDLGRYINAATGRGNLQGEHLQGAAKLLNAVFFSPRLLASRVDLIFSPLTYARTDPFVRKEAIRSMFHLAGAATTLLALASQIPGVKVVTDPRNPDWGKIKKGNTRIDIGGGFQQPLRLFAQLATGEAISSTTGKKLNLTANGFGQPTRLDLLLRFFEGKESPLFSAGTDWLRNSNQVGQKFTWGNEAATHLTPLLAQDVLDVYRSEHGGGKGLAAAAGGAALGALGFGLQSYGPKKPKSKGVVNDSPFQGGSSGGSNYFGSNSAGSAYFGG